MGIRLRTLYGACVDRIRPHPGRRDRGRPRINRVRDVPPDEVSLLLRAHHGENKNYRLLKAPRLGRAYWPSAPEGIGTRHSRSISTPTERWSRFTEMISRHVFFRTVTMPSVPASGPRPTRTCCPTFR